MHNKATNSVTPQSHAAPNPRQRVESVDAFRGFTILLMVFVIAVAAAGYRNLPHEARWFGSLPVSTWLHAEAGWDEFAGEMQERGLTPAETLALPEARLRNVGCTVTDLVAPFFVFIVGVCIPLSRSRRGGDWWRHVLSRTGMLIGAGVLYISLILGLSWWWGILQAIGIAYLMGAGVMKLPPWGRWAAIFGVLAVHGLMSHYTHWWLHFGETDRPFWTISQIFGSWQKPLTVHCKPWVSISYGAMTMIGVLVGEAVATRDSRRIVRQCLLTGAVFTAIGLAVHQIGLATGRTGLCFNKPDVTSSYAMFASGVGALTFLLFYWLVDMRGLKGWCAPLNVLGANALLAYFMQIIMRLAFRALQIEPLFAGQPNEMLQRWASAFDAPVWRAFLLDKTGWNGMLWGFIWTGCLWLIIRCCNKRGIYWKL